MVFAEVSAFSAPQQEQVRREEVAELSSRLPQSVQKTREPIADIVVVVVVLE